MKNISEQQFTELSKQAYMDASVSRKANMDKFNYKSDPILQQNDYYVSKKEIFIIISNVRKSNNINYILNLKIILTN